MKLNHLILIILFLLITGCSLENECETGIRRCVNNDTSGVLSVCADGYWGDEKNCPNQSSCNAAGDFCGECHNDSTKCENNVELICSEGKWSKSQNCLDGCSEDKKHCADSE